jgi:hypothetical protein
MTATPAVRVVVRSFAVASAGWRCGQGDHVHTGILQEAADGLGEEGVIIDDQHSDHHRFPFRARRPVCHLIRSGRARR